MITIQRNARHDGYYSEWMRTKNGELAAVSVMAREETDKPLYAYAYAHAVLTFFRLYETDNAAKMSKRQFSETLLEHIKFASQKLDVTIGSQEKHLLPFIGGCFTVSGGGAVCFVVGDAGVRIFRRKKSDLLAHSSFSHGRMHKLAISDKKLPMDSVKSAPLGDFERLSLYPLRADAKSGKGNQNGMTSLTVEKHTETAPDTPKVFRAVVTGRRHASKGQYCQDFADYAVTDAYTAASLSDGAGGGNCSEYGALMNVSSFLLCCENHIPQEQFKELLLDSIEQAHEKLIEGKPEEAIQAYATMMGVYIREGKLLCLHIGDGMIYGRRRSGKIECISDAENYYVSNRTFFTIESDADEHLFVKMLNADDYDRVLMMTDGVYNGYPVSEGSGKRAKFIKRLFNESDREDFDDVTLAGLIDTEEVLRYGDDHSALLIRLGQKED
ncbi:MAG: protein phosphatase 2C domain-containing protein [Clostridia bacterium]|nr:protein phosphatase 2C domain-containing protein [Clostridia bacterium]